VRLLLDTHVVLWAITGDRRLKKRVVDLVSDAGNDVVVSAVSIWEIAIKHALKPEEVPVASDRALILFEAAGYELLPVLPAHAAAVARLPHLHGDPFDRLLVAQALHEPLKLVTHDAVVAAYSETFILA
jgi:PIN domain nuclease of toxin-antitoxin system